MKILETPHLPKVNEHEESLSPECGHWQRTSREQAQTQPKLPAGRRQRHPSNTMKALSPSPNEHTGKGTIHKTRDAVCRCKEIKKMELEGKKV